MAKLETFTAGFKRHNSETAKYIGNCINYKGYMVQIISVGRGKMHEEGGLFDGEGDTWEVWERYEDVMKPYFDGQLAQKDGKSEQLRKYATESIDSVFKDGLEKYLLKFGMQEDYEVWNADERKNQKFVAEKKVYFQVHNCWETGINWYQLSGRYSADVFAAMKPYLIYHSEQEEEEGDWKGWCTTHNTNDIQEALQKIGWTVN